MLLGGHTSLGSAAVVQGLVARNHADSKEALQARVSLPPPQLWIPWMN